MNSGDVKCATPQRSKKFLLVDKKVFWLELIAVKGVESTRTRLCFVVLKVELFLCICLISLEFLTERNGK